MDISEQITLLIALQKIDAQIFELNKRKDEIPVLLRNMEEEFRKKGEMLRHEEEGLKTLLLKQKDKENELGSKEEMIKKYHVQLYQIKTNKEYTAMQHEIDGHKADKSLMEDEILAIFDEIDEKRRGIEKERVVLKEQENGLNFDKIRVNSELKEIEGKLSVLDGQRRGAAAKVDKGMLTKYERILKGKGSLAMVPVREDSCGGCHLNLPPQVINEIKMKAGLIFCESCARILYIEE